MDNPTTIIIICVSIILVIAGLITFYFINKKKNTSTYNEKINGIIINLGGNDNIKEISVKMSRAEFVLENYDLVNKDELKNLGVQGISKTSKKITLVVGNELANDLNKAFNK